ncbi:MAG: hypothetical protein KA182_03295 [Propionivibrio sp.]|nr:hypothetical protein [Propionivibrio sp.]
MQTISSMPDALPASNPASRPARYTLALLVATFVLPFVVGTSLYFSGWRPEKFGNHGDLIQPPRPMPEAGLLQADCPPLPTAELRGKWLLMLPIEGSCGASCRESLQQMSQVHLALNKEQSRLRRVLISTEGSPPLADLWQAFPDLLVAKLNPEAATAWESALENTGQGLLIADPLGNIIMRYDEAAEMRGVHKDLERLLKYSWIH